MKILPPEAYRNPTLYFPRCHDSAFANSVSVEALWEITTANNDNGLCVCVCVWREGKAEGEDKPWESPFWGRAVGVAHGVRHLFVVFCGQVLLGDPVGFPKSPLLSLRGPVVNGCWISRKAFYGRVSYSFLFKSVDMVNHIT